MDYFKLSNFEKEPFSNTPDPGLFYHSKQHLEALQQLEISVRLKRGLNVVLGDIGTGKTTLSRQLIQKISDDEDIEYYLILDPGFGSPRSFLIHLLSVFQNGECLEDADENQLKEQIKKFLFARGVDKDINIVVIIDEGQKLSLDCIEILRELLNFETNEHKLLQIVIFAQKEFKSSLDKVQNFKDRINLFYRLNPLNFKESKGLIQYRLRKCLPRGEDSSFFSSFGYFLVYRASHGFPRRIVNLCHQIILSMIMQNRSNAGFFLIQSCIKKVFPERQRRIVPALLVILVLVAGGFFYKEFMGTARLNLPALVASKPQHHNELKPPAPFPRPPEKTEPVSVSQAKAVEMLPEKSIDPPEIPGQSTPSDSKMENNGQADMPELYGQIRIPKKSTLSDMSRVVYGSYGPNYLSQIMRANPDIRNPKRIVAGSLINFPVLNQSQFNTDAPYLIVLDESKVLSEAFVSAFSYQLFNFKVRILPVFQKNGTFSFPVIINKAFDSQESAEAYKADIPDHIKAETRQVSLTENQILVQKG